MSERKETPDLLGEILIDQQEDILENDQQPVTKPQSPKSSNKRERETQGLVQQYETRIKQLEEERDQLHEQVISLNQQLAETPAKMTQLENEKQAKTDESGKQGDSHKKPLAKSDPSSDKISTLEDQLKQLGRKKHWWQSRRQ